MSTQIATKLTKNGGVIYYSLVQKQSEKKLKFNERLFVFLEYQYFGYITNFDRKNLNESCDLKKLKKQVPLQDLRKIVPKDNTIVLFINEYDDNGKLSSIKWTLKLGSQLLAFNWAQLLQKQESSPFRKTTQYKELQKQSSPFSQLLKKVEEQNKKINENDQKQNQKNQKSEKSEIKQEQVEDVKDKSFQKILQAQQIEPINKSNESSRLSHELQEKEILGQMRSEKRQSVNLRQSRQVRRSFKKQEERKQIKISQLLQEKIDIKKVQEEIQSYKQGRLSQKMPISSNISFKKPSISFFNYFREVPSQINDEKYFQFLNHCQNQTKKLVLQISQGSKNTTFQYPDMQVTLIETQLKQIPDKSSICDEGIYKKFIAKMKNTDYIWKLISKDQTLNAVFFLPMTCICEYRGFILYFKCKYDYQSQKSNVDYSKYFDRLSARTHIHKQVLENKQDIYFVRVKNGFVIDDVNNFLPTLIFNNSVTRPQLFEDVFANSHEEYEHKKGKKEQYQQNKFFKDKLQANIKLVSGNFEKLQDYVIHPSELSTILHVNGLNVKHLSTISSKITNSFMKDIIKTQASIRAFKMVYRKKLQDSRQNENESKKIVVDILNVLLNNSEQSKLIWKMVQLHSQLYFGIVVDRQEINKGYLLLGLQHQLGLQIHSSYTNCQKIFKCDKFVDNVQFKCKIRPCELFWVPSLHSEASFKETNQIISELGLETRGFPYYIKSNEKVYNTIMYQLTLYYDPMKFRHINLYEQLDTNNTINILDNRRRLGKVKWLIKDSLIHERQVQREVMLIKQSMNKYYGQYHPFYNQIYELLINYNKSLNKYEKSIYYCKQALTNMIQLCGGNNMHVKLASNYYQLAQCQFSWGKVDEAISQYKKAKNILQFNSYTNTHQYALIQLKLAHLNFSKYKDAQCQKLTNNSLNILKQNIPQNIQHIIFCLQLLNRCTIDSFNQIHLINNCLQVLKIGLQNQYITDEQSLKLGKIVVQYYLRREGKNRNQTVQQYLQSVADSIVQGYNDIEQAIQSFQQFVINGKLINTLENFTFKSFNYVNTKNKKLPITDKELILFDKLVRSSVCCFGQGFISGAFISSL